MSKNRKGKAVSSRKPTKTLGHPAIHNDDLEFQVTELQKRAATLCGNVPYDIQALFVCALAHHVASSHYSILDEKGENNYDPEETDEVVHQLVRAIKAWHNEYASPPTPMDIILTASGNG